MSDARVVDAVPGAPASSLTLYGRPACHLCLEAIDLLREAGLVAAFVDIDEVLELGVRYGLRIPVIAHADGRELDWPFALRELVDFAAGPGRCTRTPSE